MKFVFLLVIIIMLAYTIVDTNVYGSKILPISRFFFNFSQSMIHL